MTTFTLALLVYLVYMGLWWGYFHRYLTHQSVIYSKPMIYLMKTIQWLTTTNYWLDFEASWVTCHLKHHKYVDTIKDPHSPVFRTYTDIIFDRRTEQMPGREEVEKVKEKRKYLQPTELDMFYHKYPYGFYVLLVLCTVALGWWGILLAFVLKGYQKFIGDTFSYVAHTWPGYQNNIKTDQSRNFPYLWFVYAGEELHANHHRYAGKANYSCKWYEIDITFCMLAVLAWFKLVEIK